MSVWLAIEHAEPLIRVNVIEKTNTCDCTKFFVTAKYKLLVKSLMISTVNYFGNL